MFCEELQTPRQASFPAQENVRGEGSKAGIIFSSPRKIPFSALRESVCQIAFSKAELVTGKDSDGVL